MDATLPNLVYASHPETKQVIAIRRGVTGYYEIDTDLSPEYLNKSLRVTNAQIQAMEVGSYFGWELPGAYASYYERLQ